MISFPSNPKRGHLKKPRKGKLKKHRILWRTQNDLHRHCKRLSAITVTPAFGGGSALVDSKGKALIHKMAKVTLSFCGYCHK